MNTIERDAANELAKLAQTIADRDGIDIASAQRRAFEENPLLTQSYNVGQRVTVKSYQKLSEPQKQMLILQNNPAWIKRRANDLLDQYARHVIGIDPNEQITEKNLKTYRAGLASIKASNPSLAEASETGYISGSDWRLLSLLLPSLSKEIEKVLCAKPLINYTKDGKRTAEDIRKCMWSATTSLDQIRCYF